MPVIPALDVAEEDEPCVRMRCEPMLREAVAHERREETLRHRVIVGIAPRAHRRSYAEELTLNRPEFAGDSVS